jgi:pentatricopeptide repeat protein
MDVLHKQHTSLRPGEVPPRRKKRALIKAGHIFCSAKAGGGKGGNDEEAEPSVKAKAVQASQTKNDQRNNKNGSKDGTFLMLNNQSRNKERKKAAVPSPAPNQNSNEERMTKEAKAIQQTLMSKLDGLREKMNNQQKLPHELFVQDIKEALDLCVSLNQWESMAEIFDMMMPSSSGSASTTTTIDIPLVSNNLLHQHALETCYHQSSTSPSIAASIAVRIWNYMSTSSRQHETGHHIIMSGTNARLVALTLCQAGQLKQAMQVLQTHGNSRANNYGGVREDQDGGDNNNITSNDTLKEEDSIRLAVPLDVYDVIMNASARKGAWKEALNFLVMMERSNSGSKHHIHPVPALSTYTAVIEACVGALQAEPAAKLLLSMPPRDLHPPISSYEHVIMTCCQRQNWRRALQLFREAQKDKAGQDDASSRLSADTYNAVISCCAKGGEVSEAMKLLAELQRLDRLAPTVKTYNGLMSACAGNPRLWKTSLKLLDECNRQPGVQPDIYTYTIAMRACARGRLTSRALTLFQVAQDKGLSLDVYAYTSVMDACVKGGKWKTCLELLDQMRISTNNVKPNGYTYSVAISACGNGVQWAKAVELLTEMRQQKIPINLITYNAAITALAKASTKQRDRTKHQRGGSSSSSQKQQQRENQRQISGNKANEPKKTFRGDLNQKLKSKSILDRDYEKDTYTGNNDNDCDKIWRIVLNLLEQMQKEGVQPDAISYSSAIRACGAAGQWKEALELIRIMQASKDLKLKPNRIAYTNAILACGRAGQYQPALQLFDQMKQEGVQPDRVSYNALLSCLKTATSTADGQPQRVIDLWDEMCGRGRRENATEKSSASKVAGAPPLRFQVSKEYAKAILPDIITLTDVLAALQRSTPRSQYQEARDAIFAEAVEDLHILLPEDSLDSSWEIDLSGMSFPVARAAVKYILERRIQPAYHDYAATPTNEKSKTKKEQQQDQLQDVTFITGTGRGHQQYTSLSSSASKTGDEYDGDRNEDDNDGNTPRALREYIRDCLRDNFEPSMYSTIPANAQGTVVVKREMLQRWLEARAKAKPIE